MAKFYVVNSVTVGGRFVHAGTLVDDTVENTAAMTAAGARLYPSSNLVIAAAAAKAQAIRLRGGEEKEATDLMLAAADLADEIRTAFTVGTPGAYAPANESWIEIDGTNAPRVASLRMIDQATGATRRITIVNGVLTVA